MGALLARHLGQVEVEDTDDHPRLTCGLADYQRSVVRPGRAGSESGGEWLEAKVAAVGGMQPGGQGVGRERHIREGDLASALGRATDRDKPSGRVGVVERAHGDRGAEQARGRGQRHLVSLWSWPHR